MDVGSTGTWGLSIHDMKHPFSQARTEVIPKQNVDTDIRIGPLIDVHTDHSNGTLGGAFPFQPALLARLIRAAENEDIDAARIVNPGGSNTRKDIRARNY